MERDQVIAILAREFGMIGYFADNGRNGKYRPVFMCGSHGRLKKIVNKLHRIGIECGTIHPAKRNTAWQLKINNFDGIAEFVSQVAIKVQNNDKLQRYAIAYREHGYAGLRREIHPKDYNVIHFPRKYKKPEKSMRVKKKVVTTIKKVVRHFEGE